MLLALLGEADLLSGQVLCPRSPPDSLASYSKTDKENGWIVPGICAYVPQAAWLRNASIKVFFSVLTTLSLSESHSGQHLVFIAF